MFLNWRQLFKLALLSIRMHLKLLVFTVKSLPIRTTEQSTGESFAARINTQIQPKCLAHVSGTCMLSLCFCILKTS